MASWLRWLSDANFKRTMLVVVKCSCWYLRGFLLLSCYVRFLRVWYNLNPTSCPLYSLIARKAHFGPNQNSLFILLKRFSRDKVFTLPKNVVYLLNQTNLAECILIDKLLFWQYQCCPNLVRTWSLYMIFLEIDNIRLVKRGISMYQLFHYLILSLYKHKEQKCYNHMTK